MMSGCPAAHSCFMDVMIRIFERRFAEIDNRSRELLSQLDDRDLYRRPRELANSMSPFSIGEYLLRSAAKVEQAFGGITTRLWDDPFEWTLPEKLSTKETILGYFDEVESTRERGFAFFSSDADLSRQIPAPEQMRSIAEILLDAVGAAEHYQGRAFAVFQMLSDQSLPRL
jgi:hypothetical protein